MLKLNEDLFWDIDKKTLNLQKHERFIISRILERGNWPDFKALIKFYGSENVKQEILRLRYMDKKTLRFCSFYFNIPEEDFRCSKLMP